MFPDGGSCDGVAMAPFMQSYGGYMAGMVGSSGSGVYSAAISQSPVSDWLYYGQWVASGI